MNKRKILSILLVSMLCASTFGVVQAVGTDNTPVEKETTSPPDQFVLEIDKMTIENWSFVVGPDEKVDRTVIISDISVKNKEYTVPLDEIAQNESMMQSAMAPAEQQAQAQAKQQTSIKEGETVRIRIKDIHIQDVSIIVDLPDDMSTMNQMAKAISQSQANQMANSSSNTETSSQSQPSYRFKIEQMHIDKWAFVVGTDSTPDKKITIGDFTLKDRVINTNKLAQSDQQSMDSRNIMAGLGSNSTSMASSDFGTYCVIIQNIHIENVTFLFGGAGTPDNPGESQPDDGTTTTDCSSGEDTDGDGTKDGCKGTSDMTTTTETTTSDTTTATDSPMSETTTDSSDSAGDSGSSGTSTTTENSAGSPGFGVGVALIALIATALLAARRSN